LFVGVGIIKLLEVNLLDTIVDFAHDSSSFLCLGNVELLTDFTGDLSGGLHDFAETFLEVSPEVKVLEILRLLVELLEVSLLDTVVDLTEDISSLRSHLSVLRVASHSRSNTTSDLSSGLHDHAESLLEVAPEVEVLKISIIKILEVNLLDTVVDFAHNAGGFLCLGNVELFANLTSDLGSRLHNFAKTILEIVPEVKILHLRLSIVSVHLVELLVHVLKVSALVDILSNSIPAIGWLLRSSLLNGLCLLLLRLLLLFRLSWSSGSLFLLLLRSGLLWLILLMSPVFKFLSVITNLTGNILNGVSNLTNNWLGFLNKFIYFTRDLFDIS
jgi:hypothetical protein